LEDKPGGVGAVVMSLLHEIEVEQRYTKLGANRDVSGKPTTVLVLQLGIAEANDKHQEWVYVMGYSIYYSI
jgi:hypothetical protein